MAINSYKRCGNQPDSICSLHSINYIFYLLLNDSHVGSLSYIIKRNKFIVNRCGVKKFIAYLALYQ